MAGTSTLVYLSKVSILDALLFLNARVCMETTPTSQPLTRASIRNLLNRDARSPVSADYMRLMEIYCVVKAGGVAAQRAVAQRLEATEKEALLAAVQLLSVQPNTTNQVQALHQEIQELALSVASRLQYLATIDPAEEAIVQDCLPDIDAYFRASNRSRKDHQARGHQV